MEIGDFITVAHGSAVHGSKIEDVSMIWIKAIVFGGSVIGEGSIVGINAVVLANSKIPPRSVVVGVPAEVVKGVDDTTYSKLKKHALSYNKLSKSHKGTLF